MPENPLLPNATLQQLYSTVVRAQSTLARPALRGMEAIHAAVALQLEPGDAAVVPYSADTLEALLKPAKRGTTKPAVLLQNAGTLPFACGLAAGAQLAGKERLVVAVADLRKPGTEWAQVLEEAQRGRVPVIVLCPARATGSQAGQAGDLLDWSALNRVVKKLRFPVLTVDGGDAVAMMRALQESVLRARHGDGPALLWCLMPGSRRAADAPASRLERYLAARSIALPKAGRRRES